jgi:DNA-binding Xre family transcriptional regulator
MNISKNLKKAICGSGLNQTDLASKAGISQSLLEDFLSGKSDIYLETATKICNVLNPNPFDECSSEVKLLLHNERVAALKVIKELKREIRLLKKTSEPK